MFIIRITTSKDYSRVPDMESMKQENNYEEGTYCYFDVHSWKKANREFRVEYNKLEDIPQLTQNFTPGLHHYIAIYPTSCMRNSIS